MTDGPNWPRKLRELQNHHMDSTRWDGFPFRDDDIVIGTYAKAGTTWLQQIVSQLLFDGAEGVAVNEMSPWLDMRATPLAETLALLEAQTHRRFIKTHLPVDALVYAPQAKYIYIARDGRDVCWSLHNHHSNANADYFAAVNDTPGRVGPPLPPADPDVLAYFRHWLAHDGAPYWSFWENTRTWWGIRDLTNMLLLHFEDLKGDLPGEMRRIAAFLGIAPSPEIWAKIEEHVTFAYMRANAAAVVPGGGALWRGGTDTFVNKGTNGRWRTLLTPEDVAAYEAMAVERLGPDCAHWLAHGWG